MLVAVTAGLCNPRANRCYRGSGNWTVEFHTRQLDSGEWFVLRWRVALDGCAVSVSGSGCFLCSSSVWYFVALHRQVHTTSGEARTRRGRSGSCTSCPGRGALARRSRFESRNATRLETHRVVGQFELGKKEQCPVRHTCQGGQNAFGHGSLRVASWGSRVGSASWGSWVGGAAGELLGNT